MIAAWGGLVGILLACFAVALATDEWLGVGLSFAALVWTVWSTIRYVRKVAEWM